ncbi:MAG: DUF456 domain-containing protein [Bacteroidales bacterium]|nr:DUF456 domain-containing protein [Lentimicrobiaceae bacterium]MDD5693851.1 DUF456 domain-containing protein [Bacteroidales bacterium]
MDLVWIILGCILLIVGILGSFLPVLPGPPLAYIALLIQQFREEKPFSVNFLIIWAVVTTVVILLDYYVPIWGTKKLGGTKAGMWGATIGMFIGIFFLPPLGIILGPFIGAVVGEFTKGIDFKMAMKAGFGSFLGFIAGVVMKTVISLIMGFYLIRSFF